MKKNITIVYGSFDFKDLIVQYFFITPRFRYIFGSKLYIFINKIISKLYLGDNLNKFEFIEEIEDKYKMGILKIILYKKKQKINFINRIQKLIIEFEKSNTIGCSSCKYYNQKRKHCLLWNTKIYNEVKNKCFYWEEK